VDSVTGLTPSAQVSPGPAQLQGSAALVTNAPTSNTAVSFNGTSGYMNLGSTGPTTFNTNSSNLFVEAWVYVTSGTVARIYGRATSITAVAPDYDFTFRFSTGSLGVANGTVVVTAPGTMTNGTWNHCALSITTTGLATVFLNGQAGTSTTITMNYRSAYPTFIGAMNGDYMNGFIRDLRVVQGGVVPVATFTPLASAPFSYASPTYVANMGTTVFTLLGQFVTYNPSGKYGSSLVLLNPKVGGSSNVANTTVAWTTSTSSNAMTGVTVSYWINFYSIPPNDVNLRSLIFKYGSLYTTNYGTNLLQGMYDGSGYPGAVNTFNPTIGTWYHLTQVYGSGLITSYVNGSSLPNKGNFTTALTDSNPVLRIASDSFLDFPSSFQIDDLRIYNTALTAAQVQSVYSSQGAPAPSRAMPLPKLAWDFNGTTADYVIGLNGVNNGTSVNKGFAYTSGKYNQSLIIRNDVTGQGAPGVYNANNLVYSLTGTYSTVSGFAITTWFNCTSLSSSYRSVPLGFYGTNWSVFINIQGGSGISCQYYDGTSYPSSPGSAVLVTGVWNHIALVMIGNNLGLYVNGVYVGAAVSSIANSSTCSLELSNQYAPTWGQYDDLRIFDRSLTSSQVQAIYNQQGVPGRGAIVPQYIKSATGGNTVQDIGGYRIHTFTTVGTSTFTPASAGNVEVLVVAGGGGGGGGGTSTAGGGGGAGELIYIPAFNISGITSVSVGVGGNAGPSYDSGSNGSNSTFGSITALGGGGGGQPGSAGLAGGSGGGGGRSGSGGSSTAVYGFGNAGGSSVGNLDGNTASAGGGGGSTSVGQNAYNNSVRTPGGDGYTASISGTSTVYASGGAGGARFSGVNGSNGTVNTGNGGGGGGNALVSGGSGGSGIVIVRYPLPVRLTGTPLFTQLSPSATSSAVGAFSLRAVNGTSAKAVQVRPVPAGAGTPSAFSIIGNQFSRADSSLTPPDTSIAGQTSYNGTNQYTRINPLALTPGTTGLTISMAFKLNSRNNTLFKLNAPYPYVTIELSSDSSNVWFEEYNVTAGSWARLGNVAYTTSTNIYLSLVISGTTAKTFVNNTLFNTSTLRGAMTDATNYDLYGVGSWNGGGYANMTLYDLRIQNTIIPDASFASQDFYADRLGNLLTAPVVGQRLANWLGGATGYVTKWYDQSGRGNDAIQNTAANQPIIQRATKGPGYACVYTGNQWVSFGTLNTFTGTPFCISAVTTRTSNVTNNGITGWGNGFGGFNFAMFTLSATQDRFRSDFRKTTGLNLSGAIPVYTAGEGLLYPVCDYSSGFINRIYNKSGLLTTSGNGVDFLNTANINIPSIGLAPASGPQCFYQGEIYEVIFFTKSLYDLDGTSTITQIYQNQLGAYGT
jgi:hypothetical protein